jgi:hypothetical protein
MSKDEPMAETSGDQSTPAPSSQGTLARTWRVPDEDSSLGNLLEESLKIQVAAGDTSATVKLLELIAEQRSQVLALQQAELRLKEKELNNKHELALRGEERKTKADVATKNNTRLIIAAFTTTFTIAFLASLGYATLSKFRFGR